MHPISGGWTTDPLAGAIGQSGAAIEAHGPLQDPERAAGANAVQKGPVLLAGLLAQHTTDHLQPRLPQLTDAAPIHPGIGILQGDHNAANTRAQHRLTAGGRAAVVAAGFKGDHKGSAPGRIPGLPQRTHLGMGVSSPRMKAFAHKAAFAIKNHGPHKGVGAGVAFSKGGQGQGPPHPELPHQLRGSSCRERHSPTT